MMTKYNNKPTTLMTITTILAVGYINSFMMTMTIDDDNDDNNIQQ